MFKEAGMLFLYTETPLHAGSGTSVAAVDLPIQRERHTQYPMIQSSGIKGALRDLVEQLKEITELKKGEFKGLRGKRNEELNNNERKRKEELEKLILPIETVFGPETDRASEHGGALSFTDARILLFPVRSLTGVFAWITCPTVLERFKRDLRQIELTTRNGQALQIVEKQKLSADLRVEDLAHALVADPCEVKTTDGAIVLEDFALQGNDTHKKEVKELGEWFACHALPQQDDAYRFWRERLPKALVVVHDDVFRDFVQFSTEVISRIRIGETGTVAAGALWAEEHLPSDTLLYSLALATNPKSTGSDIRDAGQVLDFLKTHVEHASVTQLGGDETVGRGIVQVTFLRGAKADQRASTGGEAEKPPQGQEGTAEK